MLAPGTDSGSGKVTTHTYQEKGSYEIRLTVLGEKGNEITSEPQTIKVLPKPSPPSVSLSVAPSEVSPGEKITITARLTLGTIKNGILTVAFKVGSTSLESEVVEGDLDYADEIVREYTVPSKADAGKQYLQIACLQA